MKIKECHIKGFGIYKNKDFHFDDLSQFMSLNGTGKSTLADFIKYMLYDLPKKEDRIKYAPFDNDSYGGSLIIIHDGKEYRIEKDFDKKTSTKDQERIYINSQETNLKSLGNFLFKIDLEGFSKTIFINSTDLNISSSSSINLKLNNLVSKTEEDFDLKKVIDKLNDEAKLYGTRAKTSSLLLKSTEELNEKSTELKQLKEIQNILPKKYDELRLKEDSYNLICNEIKEKEEINSKAIIYEQYKNKKLEIEELKENVSNLKNKFSKLLNKEEINQIEEEIDSYNLLNKSINNEFNNSVELEKLNNLFKNESELLNKIGDVDKKIRELDLLKSKKNDANLIIINEDDKIRFEKIDVESEISNAKSLMQEYKDLNEKIVLNNETKNNNKKNNLNIFLIPSFSILIIGIVLLILNNIIPGVIISIIGFLISVIILFLNYKPKKNDVNESDSLLKEYRLKEKELNDILARYRYNDDTYESKLNHLINDYDKYIINLNHNEEIIKNNELLNENINSLKTEIEAFLNIYLNNEYDEYVDALKIIYNKYNRYIYLLNEKETFDLINKENINKLNHLKNILGKRSIELNINFNELKDYLDNMNNNLISINLLNERINKDEENLNKYIIDNDININLNYEKIDLNSLIISRDDLNKEIISLKNEIDNYDNLVERIPYLEAECINLEEKIKNYKHKAKIISLVVENLEEADNSLKEKYIKPLKDKFVKYANILDSILKDNISFDSNFNLKLIRNGNLFNDVHLSKGEATIAMLCYRLALIDIMYENKPFIILDDPFVNLDEPNLKNALKLIKEISNDTQILYFTCIDGRKI